MVTSSITVNISSNAGGSATLLLYAHDRMLADAPASLVCQSTVHVPSSTDGSPERCHAEQIIINFSTSDIEQAGTTWDDMVDASLYISIDVDKSDLTYTSDGPVFDVKPGSVANLKLQAKSK